MRRIKLTAFLWVIRFINFCSPVLLSWVFLDCNVAVNLMLHGHLPERHQHGSPEKSWKSICSAASICPQNLVPGCIWCNLVILGGSCSSVWCQTFNIGLRNPRPLMSCPISLSVCKHLHTETHCESVVYLDNLGQTRSFILCWWSFWTTTTQRLRLFSAQARASNAVNWRWCIPCIPTSLEGWASRGTWENWWFLWISLLQSLQTLQRKYRKWMEMVWRWLAWFSVSHWDPIGIGRWKLSRFSPRPDGYWPPEPWCSRGDAAVDWYVACMVQGSQWQLQTQWKLYGNSMETQLSYSFAYCRFAHTHTAESTRFLALENQLKNMLQEFGTVCPLFQQGNLPVLLNALKWFRMTCTCRHRLNVSPTFGSWSCRRSASTSWSAWSNRQTAPSDAVWSRVYIYICIYIIAMWNNMSPTPKTSGHQDGNQFDHKDNDVDICRNYIYETIWNYSMCWLSHTNPN